MHYDRNYLYLIDYYYFATDSKLKEIQQDYLLYALFEVRTEFSTFVLLNLFGKKQVQFSFFINSSHLRLFFKIHLPGIFENSWEKSFLDKPLHQKYVSLLKIILATINFDKIFAVLKYLIDSFKISRVIFQIS